MLNKVQLIGRLGGDPEVRHLENNTVVARVNLATSEKYKDKNGQLQELTEWHTVIFWNQLAEIVEKYCKKGKQIYVEGKLTSRQWQTESGEKRYTTEVKAQNLILLGDAPGGGNSNRPPTPNDDGSAHSSPMTNSQPPIDTNAGDDDLPF